MPDPPTIAQYRAMRPAVVRVRKPAKPKPATLAAPARTEVSADLVARLLTGSVLLEPCPEANDPVKLREHCVGTMLKLTRHPDPVVVYHAVNWVSEYADYMTAKQAAPKSDPVDRERLLGELRGLYSKALNRPPIIEAVAEETTKE